jgi:hypothetical protein
MLAISTEFVGRKSEASSAALPLEAANLERVRFRFAQLSEPKAFIAQTKS